MAAQVILPAQRHLKVMVGVREDLQRNGLAAVVAVQVLLVPIAPQMVLVALVEQEPPLLYQAYL